MTGPLSLIAAIEDAGKHYEFPAAAAEHLLDDFTPKPGRLRDWIFDLSDPAPRSSPFVTDDYLAGFTREVSTRGQDSTAKWAELTPTEQRRARQIERFAQQKKRMQMGPGRSQNVDRALILYVMRRIEERTGVTFRFSRPRGLKGAPGGPMLRLAEAALRRLLCSDDRMLRCLDLVCPACHYTPKEIAQTAVWARTLARASRRSPAAWSSELILAFPSDVRRELVLRQTTRREREGSPDLAGTAAGAVCETRPVSYSSVWVGLDQSQEQKPARPRPRMILVSERILTDPPASPPPSMGGEA